MQDKDVRRDGRTRMASAHDGKLLISGYTISFTVTPPVAYYIDVGTQT